MWWINLKYLTTTLPSNHIFFLTKNWTWIKFSSFLFDILYWIHWQSAFSMVFQCVGRCLRFHCTYVLDRTLFHSNTRSEVLFAAFIQYIACGFTLDSVRMNRKTETNHAFIFHYTRLSFKWRLSWCTNFHVDRIELPIYLPLSFCLSPCYIGEYLSTQINHFIVMVLYLYIWIEKREKFDEFDLVSNWNILKIGHWLPIWH